MRIHRKKENVQPFSAGILVSISPCTAGDRGPIPRRGGIYYKISSQDSLESVAMMEQDLMGLSLRNLDVGKKWKRTSLL